MKILRFFTSLFLITALFAAATVSNSGTLFALTLDTDDDITEVSTEEEELITEVPTDEPLPEVPTDEPLPEVPDQPGPTGTIVNDTTAMPDICPPNCLIIASPTDIQQGNLASIELIDTVNETLTVAGQSRQVPTIQSQLIIGTPEQIVSIALDQIRTTETNQTRIAVLEQFISQVVDVGINEDGIKVTSEIGIGEKEIEVTSDISVSEEGLPCPTVGGKLKC